MVCQWMENAACLSVNEITCLISHGWEKSQLIFSVMIRNSWNDCYHFENAKNESNLWKKKVLVANQYWIDKQECPVN